MKQLVDQFLLSLLLINCISNVTAGPVSFKAKSIICQANSMFISNVSCNLIAVSWVKSYVNADCYLLQPVKDITIEATFFKKDNTNQFKPFMFPFNFSVCQEDMKYQLIPFSDLVIKHLRTYTNVNHSCPYMGHIFARQLLTDEGKLPNVPISEYKMIFRFFEYPNFLGQMTAVLEVFEDHSSRRKLKTLKSNSFGINLSRNII